MEAAELSSRLQVLPESIGQPNLHAPRPNVGKQPEAVKGGDHRELATHVFEKLRDLENENTSQKPILTPWFWPASANPQ